MKFGRNFPRASPITLQTPGVLPGTEEDMATTASAVEAQIRYHEERASYLDANPYVHTNMDEEEHRAEAERLRAILPAVVAAEQRAAADAAWAEQAARVERVRQRRARWGC